MKHFINKRETLVTEALDGLLMGGGDLARLDGYPEIKVVRRRNWDGTKVAVISGGGAGHEPAHAGYVGRGMLAAAVSGDVFASPSVEAVLAAIRSVTGTAGCLLVVKNYTGDRLNFGLAAERARAEGLDVTMVIVADDTALPDITQPRGVAGTLFVHKVAGHLAETGASLAEVTAAATAAADEIYSFGVSLSTCTIPGQPGEERLRADELELGLGIHGEPGVAKIALEEVRSIVGTVVERLQNALPSGDGHYAALLNNLGAVPAIEMSVIAYEILSSDLGRRVELMVGPGALLTSLNMNGFSLSLLKLDDTRRAAIQSDVAPLAWPGVSKPAAIEIMPLPGGEAAEFAASDNAQARGLIETVCNRLIGEEAALNALDAKSGDGDTGSTVTAGARGVLTRLDDLPLADAEKLCLSLGSILGAAMGGSSGVLLSIFFTAAGEALAGGASTPAALKAGLARMQFYGGAKLGDRSMVDVLVPALDALDEDGLAAAADAAEKAAEGTANLAAAKVGRSAYVGAADLAGVKDPGAVAVAAAFRAAVPS